MNLAPLWIVVISCYWDRRGKKVTWGRMKKKEMKKIKIKNPPQKNNTRGVCVCM